MVSELPANPLILSDSYREPLYSRSENVFISMEVRFSFRKEYVDTWFMRIEAYLYRHVAYYKEILIQSRCATL
jgi:hypothetical protein